MAKCGGRVSPDADYATTLKYGKYRRWVVFVRPEDVTAATHIAREADFPSANLPTPFASGLCARHGYETEPCSGCSTGYDWWAKSDDVEQIQVPPRHANPLTQAALDCGPQAHPLRVGWISGAATPDQGYCATRFTGPWSSQWPPCGWWR